MKYDIIYSSAYPIVRCSFAKGEKIKAESNSMVAMSDTVDVEGVDGRGRPAGEAGRVGAGGRSFFQYLSAVRGDGEVYLAHALPGSIEAIELSGTYSVKLQKGCFLASEMGVTVSPKAHNLFQGIISGDTFYVLDVSGSGTLFVCSFGAIHKIDIPAGRDYVVDNSHLIAWHAKMPCEIRRMSSNMISAIASGEGMACVFKGPGSLYIQTRNPAAFRDWMTLKASGRKGGK